MSTSIDEKVVKLKLDSGQMTSGIKSTISSLSSLDAALKKTGSGFSGFDRLKNAFSGFSLGSLPQAVSDTSSQFSVLDIAAGVTLGGIATKAITAGASMLKSLSMDGIIGGFKEYETQLNSVQTILANTQSKGESIETVNAALDQLNTYADKTIYNFTEMTSNIGRFTSAGVGLEDSVAAIQGISNLAAASGSNSQQASSAMYQLSQAIASGTVKLMDWNSVVNAGMGGEQFQQALMRTARAHGVAVDELIAKNGSFRDSLQEDWLSSDIMIESLRLMTDEVNNMSDAQLNQMGYTANDIAQIRMFANTAQDAATKFKTWTQVWDTAKESVGSGWAKTWQLLIGDFQQAGALWTMVGNAITGAVGAISDARNNLLEGFVDMGGRTAVLNTLLNLIKAIGHPLMAIGRAFLEVFSGPSASGILTVAKAIEKLTSMLVMSEANMGRLQRAFVGVFSVIHVVTTVLGWFIKLAAGVGYVVLRVAGWIGSKLVTALLMIVQWIGPVGKAFDSLVKWLDPIGRLMKLVAIAVSAAAAVFGTLGATIKAQVAGPLSTIKSIFIGIRDAIGEKLSGAIQTVQNALSAFDGFKFSGLGNFTDILMKIGKVVGLGLAGTLLGLVFVLQKLGDAFTTYLVPAMKTAGAYLKSAFGDVLEYLGKKVETTQFIFEAVFGNKMIGSGTLFGKVMINIAEAAKYLYDKAKLVQFIFAGVFSGKQVGSGTKFGKVVIAVAEALKTVYDKAMDFKEQITDFFDIPSKKAKEFGDSLIGSIKAFEAFSDFGGKALDSMNRFTGSLSSVRDILLAGFSGQAISDLTGYKAVLAELGTIAGNVVNFFRDAKTVFANAFSGGDILQQFTTGSMGELQTFAQALANFGDEGTTWTSSLKLMATSLGGFFKELALGVDIDFAGIFDSIVAQLQKIKAAIVEFWNTNISPAASVLWGGIKAFVSDMTGGLGGVKGEAQTLGQWFATDFLGYFSTLVSKLKSAGSAIASALGGTGDSISTFIKDNFNTNTFAMALQGFTVGGFIAAFMKIKDTFSGTSFTSIGSGLSSIGDAIAGFQQEAKSDVIKSIAISIGILAASLYLLSKVPMDGIGSGLIGIAGTMVILIGAMSSLTKMNTDGANFAKLGILALAVAGAALLMAKAAIALGNIDTKAAVQGSIAVGVIIGALMGFTKLMPVLEQGKSMSIKTGVNFVLMAGSIFLIGMAVQKLGSMDIAAVTQGIIVTGLIFGILALYSNFGAQNMKLGNAASLLVTAYAMVSIGTALTLVGLLPMAAALQGVMIMGLAFAQISIMMLAMSKTNPMAGAAMMLGVSALLLSIGNILMLFAAMSWSTFLASATMMAISLGILVVAMNAAQGGVAGAAAVLLLAAAMAVLAPVIAMLGALPWQVAAAGIVILAAGLAVLVVAGYAAMGAAPGLAAIALAALALSASVVIAAAGLTAFAAGVVAMGIAIMSVVGAFAMIGSTAAQMTSQFLPMLGLAGVMAVFGAALIVVGAGALAAGVGFVVLGAGLLAMGLGFTMIMATAPAATVVLQNAVKQIGDMWKSVIKATAVAAGLVAIGAALLGFGVGALAAGAGGTVMAAGLALAFMAMSRFQPLFQQFVASVSGSGTTNAALKNIGTSATLVGNNVKMAATSLALFKTSITGIGNSATMAATGIRMLSATMLSSFASMGVAATSFSTTLRTATMGIVQSMQMLGPSVGAQSNVVRAALLAMAGNASVAMLAFATAIRSGAGLTTAAMNMLRVAIAAGATLVITGLSRMTMVGRTSMAAFTAAMSTGSTAATTRMAAVARGVNTGANLVSNALTQMVARTRAQIAAFGATLAAGASAASNAMYRIAGAISSGASSSISAMSNAISGIRNAAVGGLNNTAAVVYNPAYNIGMNIANGIANGISAGRSRAINAASSMASASLAAAKAALDIHSPSREFYKVGRFVDQGMENGIRQNASAPERAAKSMAQKVIDAADLALLDISDELSPTVTPVLDMSLVRSGASSLGDILGTPALSPSASIHAAQAIAAGLRTTDDISTSPAGNREVKVEFNQYNNSPKALDRLEIYRQTRNQISQVEGALKAL